MLSFETVPDHFLSRVARMLFLSLLNVLTTNSIRIRMTAITSIHILTAITITITITIADDSLACLPPELIQAGCKNNT